MKIESIIKRDGGSRIDIDDVVYHFAPQADGAHVAEVDDDEHAQRFLSIREGYKIYRAADEGDDEPEVKKPAARKK